MLVFPTFLFTPSSLSADLIGASVGGGASLSGLSQAVMTSGGGYWGFTFGEAVLWDRLRMKTWRALSARSDGGATPFIVPLSDRRHQAFLPANVRGGPDLTNSDGTGFSDGTAWGATYVTATMDADAALRATQISVAIAGAAPLEGGEFFSIWHFGRGVRMYEITAVYAQAAGVADLEIRPPLREATGAGVVLDFDNPRCQMTAQGGMAPVLEQLRFGKSPTVKFVENFTPVGG